MAELPKSIYGELVPVPKRSNINSGLHSAHPKTLEAVLGIPRLELDSKCRQITDQPLLARMRTANVGPFYATGLLEALESLQRVFAAVKKTLPELHAVVGSAGMLCVRLARGSEAPSSHAWGTAIDLTIDGILDVRGDNMTQRGLLKLYRHFHAEGWYWGAAFPTEDAMHFELAEETVLQLAPTKRV